jgi:hypothetical protein
VAEQAAEYKVTPLPCPFCGGSNFGSLTLLFDWDEIEDLGLSEHADKAGGVEGVQCELCQAGAPAHVWNKRHSPPLESTVGWHYPKDNADLENMPAPDETVVAYYRDEIGMVRGPVIHPPILSTGLHLDKDGRPIYRPTIRWHAIPEE